jgi:WD40 repeat protein
VTTLVRLRVGVTALPPLIFVSLDNGSSLTAAVWCVSTVRLWSVSQRRLLRKALLDCPARALAWSPDGRTLVAGLGGSSIGTRQKKDGAVRHTWPFATSNAC